MKFPNAGPTLVAVMFVVAMTASIAAGPPLGAQQVADTAFRPRVDGPTFTGVKRPVVAIDEAHHNFHTATERYRPFAALLERDGLVVRPNRAQLGTAVLDSIDILVIANALHERNAASPDGPTLGAFDATEVSAVVRWVQDGGSLLLVADHMPFAGAAAELASALGLEFIDGFLMDSTASEGEVRFRRADLSLRGHAVTDGHGPASRVDSVTAFLGQAFRLRGPGTPLLMVADDLQVLKPVRPWEFAPSTPRIPARGLLQGAALERGRGRVVVLGEAAMITAQRAGPDSVRVGWNHRVAGQNGQFALNVMRWLARAGT